MKSPIQRSNRLLNRCSNSVGLYVGLTLFMILQCNPVSAVPIEEDPNGFEGIPWGTLLSGMNRFIKVDDNGHMQTFQPIEQPPMFGGTPVDAIRFTTFQHRFGRVTVRYRGKTAHEVILNHLQSTYGPLDQTPGQIAVGPVKVYAWHGLHTEVTLRFEADIERGIIFIESRTLPERWSEEGPSTVF